MHTRPRPALPPLLRASLYAGLYAVLALALAAPAGARASTPGGWVESWGQAMVSHVDASHGAPHLRDATLRQAVRLSVGGSRLRVRLSNINGAVPLVIDAATVAPGADDPADATAIDPAHSLALRFDGAARVTLAPGTSRWSDAVALPVPALSRLVVSMYVRGDAALADYHPSQSATTTTVAAGNALQARSLAARALRDTPEAGADGHIYLLSGVAVLPDHAVRGIVAFGDSITDGAYATAPDKPWPAVLATLANRAGAPGAGVVNAGIGGNELTADQPDRLDYGPAALTRFERDVIDRDGVTDVIVLLGTNDLNRGLDASGRPRGAPAHAIIDGLRLLADAAHARGLRIHAGSIPPLAGFPAEGWYSPATEATRLRVNQWLRDSGAFDSVLDFASALAGAYTPSPQAAAQQPLPAGMAQVCAGDAGLHPNDRGYAVMGTLAYDALFATRTPPPPPCH